MDHLLDGTQVRSQLAACVPDSKNVRLAIAFWGDGAIEALALPKSLQHVKIVCNLRLGGTNPAEIRKLIKAGANVRHSDQLHAKIYLLDEHAVVGSSNASSNGLSFQNGDSYQGWTEANILIGRGAVYDEVERLFARIWREASEVNETDLKDALKAWTARRRAALADKKSAAPDLLTALYEQPALFQDRRYYLTIDDTTISEEAESDLSRHQSQLEDAITLSAWEDWDDMPANATFISFWKGRRRLYFDGFYKTLDPSPPVLSGQKTNLQLVYDVNDVHSISEVGDITQWRKITARILKKYPLTETVCIDLGEVAHDFLHE